MSKRYTYQVAPICLDSIFLQLEENLSKGSFFFPSESLQKLLDARYICVYGHGSGYNSLKSFILDKFHLTASVIIDNKYIGVEDRGNLLLISPDIQRSDKRLPRNCGQDCVIVSLGDVNQYEAVRRLLLKKGYERPLWALEIPEYHFTHSSKEEIGDCANQILLHRPEISKSFSLLMDEESRLIFLQLIENYAFGKLGAIPHRDISSQYQFRESGLPISSTFSVFVDCGSHHGETIKVLMMSGIKKQVKKIIAFEPDPINYSTLQEQIRNFSEVDIHCFQSACAGTSKPLLLSTHLGVNSFILSPRSTDAGIEVEGIDLDSIQSRFDLSDSFIKMDIEGSEMEALRGCVNILQNFRPLLAISIYHRLSDLWSFISFLDELNLGYKFWLRNYTGFAAETILYASCQKDQ